MLRLENRHCVVVGGGRVAARKVAELIQTGARITIISPEFAPTLAALADDRKITALRTAYGAGTPPALRPFLAFAATAPRALHRQVPSPARSAGALVAPADSRHARDLT